MSGVSDHPHSGTRLLRDRAYAIGRGVLAFLAQRFLIRHPGPGENEATRSLMRTVAFSFIHSFIVLVLFLSIIPLIGNNFSDGQQAASQRVTLTSHQHALSQRMIILASDLRQGRDSVRKELEQAHAQFVSNHAALLALMSAEVPRIGFGPLKALATQDRWQQAQADLLRFTQATQLLLEASDSAQADAAWLIVHDLGRETIYHDLCAAMNEAHQDFIVFLDWLRWGRLFVTLLIALVSMGILALILRPLVVRIREHTDVLDQQARIDSLTGVMNRRAVLEAGAAELLRAHREGHELAVLLFDLDHFKRVNDCYGHSAGDAVLKHFTSVLRRMVRASDPFGRIGGEEFVLVAPRASMSAAVALAEKLRVAVANSAGDLYPEITVSVGVAMAEPGELSLEPALARADEALYRAKHGGRNRVSVSSNGAKSTFSGPLQSSLPSLS